MTAGGPLRQPIPIARSILWAPVSAGPQAPADMQFPVFLSQSALSAIQEHLASPPSPGQGILGFLLGDVCECSETGVSYLVVDAALRLNQPISADRTREVVTRLWDRINEQLEAQKAHLIGWYHTHPPLPLELSEPDVETHEHYFAEAWQVALLLGADASEPEGALFRERGDEDWTATPLAFYELMDEGSIRGGKKRSVVAWKNYRPFPTTGPQPADVVRAPTPAAPPRPRPADPPPVKARAPSDSGELKFLTAAEDIAGPSRPSPRAPLPPPPPSPPAPAPALGPIPRGRPGPDLEPETEEPSEVEPISLPASEGEEIEPPVEVPEEPEERPRERVPRARRRGRGRRRWLLVLGCVVALAAGGAYWLFQPALPSLPTLPALHSLPKLPPLPSLQKLASLPPLVWSRIRGMLRPAAPPARRIPPQARTPSATPAPPRPEPSHPAATTPAPQPPPVPPPAPLGKLDQLADALVGTVRGFRTEAGQFDRQQLPCPGLAQSLVAVESRWASYNAARKEAGVLDAAHAARDQQLYASVDSVERRFEQSGCARP